jgi:mycofactocin glycosyltransferase
VTAPERDEPAPVPAGFCVVLDPSTKQLTESILFGGSPARAIRLSEAGCRALDELQAGPVRSAGAGVLARRLTDAGLAHPRPPAADAGLTHARPPALDVTVLIPVRDRAALLDQCLAGVGRRYPVIVVDDGSADPTRIAEVSSRHGATLMRRDASGGPAAARNTGLSQVDSDLVAFLDSDCVPPPDWIERLAPHLADPLVGAVAPRVVAPDASASKSEPSSRGSTASRYAAACGSLDLGPGEALVVPATKVAYVPTAALLVRRAALASVARAWPSARPGGLAPFDPALRYGEDVDLVWRLHDAGWRVRYEPAVQVPHHGPDTWPGLLARRLRYGTSAAPLARRHPGRLAPLVLQPWPTVTVAALLARRPAAAAAAAITGWLALTSTVRRAGLPADGAAAASLTAVRQTWLGIGRYATQFAAPALAAALVCPGGATPARRWGRRAAAASLLLGPVVDAWRQCRPDVDPVRFTLGHVADDIAYGSGVWAGCLRELTLAPVTPVISWRPLRVTGPVPPAAGRPGKEPPGKEPPGKDPRGKDPRGKGTARKGTAGKEPPARKGAS